MKYPYDIVSYVRNKTFSIEAHFTRMTEESPIKVFDDKFSRFVMTVIANSKAVTCNVPLDELSQMIANTEYAYQDFMKNKYAVKSSSGNTSPAYTTKFAMGTLKGKTPADVLIENGEAGKDILNKQYKFLKENLKDHPNNQKLIDAIVDAGHIDLSKISKESVASVPTIEILSIGCRPLIRKKREDGLCFCYEAKVEWDSSRNYPVAVRISNYYAPVEKKEDGTLNVLLAKKDRKTELTNEFNMTSAEWLNAVDEMRSAKEDFRRMYRADGFKLADKAFFDAKEAAKDATKEQKPA